VHQREQVPGSLRIGLSNTRWTCVRDYIHTCDLATAHLLALQRLESGDLREVLILGPEREQQFWKWYVPQNP